MDVEPRDRDDAGAPDRREVAIVLTGRRVTRDANPPFPTAADCCGSPEVDDAAVADPCCATPINGFRQGEDACCGAVSTFADGHRGASADTRGKPARSTVIYRVEELDCATEENDLRRVLTPLGGIRSLEFNVVARQVRVGHDLDDPAPIEAAIRALGMRASPP